MAISFVGSNTNRNVSGTALTVGLPATETNDLVVFFSACGDVAKGGPPSTSGYTTIADVITGLGPTCRLHASYSFVPASTAGLNVNVPGTGSSSIGLLGAALVFRGVHATPLDVAVTTFTANSVVPNAPAITPSSNDCCIVVAAANRIDDSSAGSISGYLPSPSVQDHTTTGSLATTIAAAYRVLSGGASVAEDPLAWSTWGSASSCSLTIALRPIAFADLNTVDPATVTVTGKAVVERELVAVSKASVSYLGKTIGIPDSSVEAIFVDKYRMVITGQTVNVIETFRAVTVTPAAVLYRGRGVTVRDIQFEDIPRYSIKGRGSGIWMETR